MAENLSAVLDSMTEEYISNWLHQHPLDPVHIDCVTAVMLKILDGKCKMLPKEKLIMTLLYDQVKSRPGIFLGDDIHQLIGSARKQTDEHMRLCVYEKRILAETTISRPTMKMFKAMVFQQGLFDEINNTGIKEKESW